MGPHVGPESDGDKKYRSNEELNFWKSHDLINIYQKEFNLIFNKEVKIIEKNLKILYNKSAKQKFYKISNWQKKIFQILIIQFIKKFL